MGPSLRFGVLYDFRNPADSGLSMPDLYAQVLDQVDTIEALGYDMAWFTEHHFVEDGYLPSWVPVAGAILGRTKRLRVGTDIALLPFYHPVRLAEDLAVLDNLSNGRVEMGVGMGYAPHEFAGFGIPIPRRVSLTEEGLDVLRLAWSGEKFSYHGKRYGSRAVLDLWRSEVAAAGGDPSQRRVGIIRPWLVTDDRDRDWPPIRAAERYRMKVYARFFEEADVGFGLGVEGAISQNWIIGSPDQVEEQLGDFIEEHGFTDLITHGVPPGMSPDQITPSLTRFANEVMPALRARFDR
jgi:alkanesulfonate monooxygenase SsuD/methylene tetrahydromethanopterin reductase-like flavin-dependent oxidoreductase (luciferase family)